MTYAEKIKKIRKTKKLTQLQLSLLLNVSLQSVSNWEKGINMSDFQKDKIDKMLEEASER